MLNISIAQMAVVRGEVDVNLEKAKQLIKEAARRGSALICLPEMWTTGFNFEDNIIQCKHQDSTVAAIAKLAKKYKIAISGSILFYNEAKQPTNTHMIFDQNGELIANYAKIHLFSFMHEDQYVAAGNKLVTTELSFGKVGLATCYDVRFCELFRSYALQGAELVLLPAAFPYPRLAHWQTLIKARAIENQFFMVATNQVGNEAFAETEVTYLGHSCIIDPWGETVIAAGDSEEILLTAEIDLNLVKTIREKMHVFADRRPDLYQL